MQDEIMAEIDPSMCPSCIDCCLNVVMSCFLVVLLLLWCPNVVILLFVLCCFTVVKLCVIVFINELIANSGTANELCIVPAK